MLSSGVIAGRKPFARTRELIDLWIRSLRTFGHVERRNAPPDERVLVAPDEQHFLGRRVRVDGVTDAASGRTYVHVESRVLGAARHDVFGVTENADRAVHVDVRDDAFARHGRLFCEVVRSGEGRLLFACHEQENDGPARSRLHSRVRAGELEQHGNAARIVERAVAYGVSVGRWTKAEVIEVRAVNHVFIAPGSILDIYGRLPTVKR